MNERSHRRTEEEMAQQESRISGITPRYTQTGHLTGYIVEVRHDGLNEIRTIADRDEDTAIRKAQALGARWDEKWQRVEHQRSAQEARHASKQEAEARTADAQKDLLAATTILVDAVDCGPLPWKNLEDHRVFEFSATDTYPSVIFGRNGIPVGIKEEKDIREPQANDSEFAFEVTLWDKLWPASRREKQEKSLRQFDAAHQRWRNEQDAVNARRAAAELQLNTAKAQFEADATSFRAEQTAANDKIAVFRQRYEAREPEAIVEYCELVLSGSRYPTFIDPEYQVHYNSANSVAVVECELPDKDAIPTLQKVTYTASSRDFKEKHITDNERDRLFDSVLYQIALRTINELFQADSARALKTVVFNGWVNGISLRKTGPGIIRDRHKLGGSEQESRDEKVTFFGRANRHRTQTG